MGLLTLELVFNPIVPGKLPEQNATQGAAKKPLRLSKKQSLLEKVKAVVQPLTDLPPLVRDPNFWLTVKGSFEAAIESKMSVWFVDTTEQDSPVTKVDKFRQDHEEILKSEDVAALPIDQVCEKAVAAAKAVLAFRDGMKSWTMPCAVDTHRKKLMILFSEFDEALADVMLYEQTIEGWAAKADIDEATLESKAKRHVKDLKNKLFGRLTAEGYSKALSKVIDVKYKLTSNYSALPVILMLV